MTTTTTVGVGPRAAEDPVVQPCGDRRPLRAARPRWVGRSANLGGAPDTHGVGGAYGGSRADTPRQRRHDSGLAQRRRRPDRCSARAARDRSAGAGEVGVDRACSRRQRTPRPHRLRRRRPSPLGNRAARARRLIGGRQPRGRRRAQEPPEGGGSHPGTGCRRSRSGYPGNYGELVRGGPDEARQCPRALSSVPGAICRGRCPSQRRSVSMEARWDLRVELQSLQHWWVERRFR
jgi:hypothetical protein